MQLGNVLVSLALETLDELHVVGVGLVLVQEGPLVVHEVLVGDLPGPKDLDAPEVVVLHLLDERDFGEELLALQDRVGAPHNNN